MRIISRCAQVGDALPSASQFGERMPLLLVALFLFTAVQAAAENFPIGEQSDITQIPSPTDILRQEDKQVTNPFDHQSGDVFESLLQELNERGVFDPLPPSVLVPSKSE
jgi:hypothetical protein